MASNHLSATSRPTSRPSPTSITTSTMTTLPCATGLLTITLLVGCQPESTGEANPPLSVPAVASPSTSDQSDLERVADPHYAFDPTLTRAARNPAQGFSVVLTGHGARLEEDASLMGAPGFAFDMQLASISRGADRAFAEEPRMIEVRDNEVQVARADESREWFINGPHGLEHGYVLPVPPGGSRDDELMIEVELSGDLYPRLDHETERVRLVDGEGRTRLYYGHLYVFDANGVPLDAHLEVIDDAIAWRIDDRSAVYPITIDPLIWGAHKKLLAMNAMGGDGLSDVSVDGSTVAIGANLAGFGNEGAAYIFERDLGGTANWGEAKKLTSASSEQFANSIDVSGDIVVAGAFSDDTLGLQAGAAYVFARNLGGANNWGEVKKIYASDPSAGARFGLSVALSGDTLLVGGDGGFGGDGAAYVYGKDVGGANQWGAVAKLLPSDPAVAEGFGYAVDLNGDIAVVGAHYSGLLAGAAYVFERNQGGPNNWGQVRKLSPSQLPDNGVFGFSVAVHGDVIVVGAASQPPASGAAHVFMRNQGGANNWGEVKLLTGTDSADADDFGYSVAVSGNRVLVGAVFHDGVAPEAGAAYVFEKDAGGVDNWGQTQKLFASDAMADDWFGFHVAAGPDEMFVVATKSDTAIMDVGAAYVFRLESTNGDPCADASTCASGFCVDGVCCESSCSNGCTVCSVAAGASANGVCSPVADGTSCEDGFFCNGMNTCAGGDCMVSDPCPGPDGDADCRESCDESSRSCIAADFDGEPCNDGLSCNGADACQSGQCAVHTDECSETGGAGGEGAAASTGGAGAQGGVGGQGAGGQGGNGDCVGESCSDDSGCQCNVPGRNTSSRWAIALSLLALGAGRWRRSRARRANVA